MYNNKKVNSVFIATLIHVYEPHVKSVTPVKPA